MRVFGFVVVLILFAGSSCLAQWTDSSNKFADSLHMPVSKASGEQSHSYIVKSEDGGYFIIWEDTRNDPNLADIYAQKYDKDGKQLWAADGVPVATSAQDERWDMPQNVDYRRGSPAAPDGAGGLYVSWAYSIVISPYSYYGVGVQHLRANGSRVFGDAGSIVGEPSGTTNTQWSAPQILPDGIGGFFIGMLRTQGNYHDCFLYAYKEEGGSLKQYAGGQMDQYARELTTGSPCGVQYYVSDAFDAAVQSFNIYSDQQGGCNVVMALATNSQQLYLGYNRLVRVKKDSHVTVVRRIGGDSPANTSTTEKFYKKDSLVRLYNYRTYTYTVSCRPQNDPNSIVTVSNTRIENNGLGYLPLNDAPKFEMALPQGVILPTGGNINAEIIATGERALDGQGGLTSYHLHGYYRLNEIYDSLPYQLCTDLDHPYEAFRPTLPEGALPTDTLMPGPDTLIAHPSNYQENFAMAGSGNKVWLSKRGAGPDGVSVYLQELKLVSAGTKKYTFAINTKDKLGVKIGQEVYTNFTGTQIYYNMPGIVTDGNNGHALFYVQEADRYVRVSPIEDGGVLSWGAMGKPISGGYWAGYPIQMGYPHAVLSDNGKGLVVWNSGRRTENVNSGLNVWMQRISDIFTTAYQPPQQTLKLVGTQITQAVASFFAGSTNAWTTIQVPIRDLSVDGTGLNNSTPVVSIVDNYALGAVYVNVFENTGALRVTNGKPYLNRNLTILVGNNPNGSGNIPMRLYIPQSQFDALKAADPSINTPGDLGVIKQPNAADAPSYTLPQTYTPIIGEEMVPLTGWGAIDGGYYIEFVAKGFSNFFIARGAGPLPLKWLDVQGKYTAPAEAAITWTVTEEHNVKGYTVQYSADGVSFADGCTTTSGNSGSTAVYDCTVPLPGVKTYSFRVRQEDLDGRSTFSKVIVLEASNARGKYIVGPNPAHDQAVLRIPPGAVVKQVVLVSGSGQAVWQTAGLQSLTGSLAIPLGQLPAGVYHLRVIHDKGVQLLKVVKE